MNLHDAIYTPRATAGYQWESKNPIADETRRIAKLHSENIEIGTTKQ